MLERPILGVIMDPISSICPKKDTTLALLIQAQQRGFELYYLELNNLFLQYGIAWGYCRSLQVFNNEEQWYSLGDPSPRPLDQFDILLMRKDPPVDMQYIYATYILERAEQNGVLVVNKPQSLRDANEKLFATCFPQCMPPTLVSSDKERLIHFIQEYQNAVLKPLDGMGGKNIVKCNTNDPNTSVLIDLLTQKGSTYIMAQQYIPEILTQGDKRILLIDGEPLPYGLARMPAGNSFLGNLAAGGQGIGRPLTDRDLWICAQIGPMLREKGLLLVGIDVIGDYLTEINVTSPTCVKELEKEFEVDITSKILDCIIDKLQA
jgi:glutathione synthase